jgi:hypothetical protein
MKNLLPISGFGAVLVAGCALSPALSPHPPHLELTAENDSAIQVEEGVGEGGGVWAGASSEGTER